MVIGGSLRYPGALMIACRAAARCGSGVVTAAAGRSVVELVGGQDPNTTFYPLAEAAPGVIAVAAAAQLSGFLGESIGAVLIGPGLAHGPGIDDFVAAVLRNARGVPMVVDADGLNALARTESWTDLLPAKVVLTPHDREAARLAGRVVPSGADRLEFARQYAQAWRAVVVLKGAQTVVSDGKRTLVHDVPNPALGVGGSGDALAGAIAAFMARGLTPFGAATAAVWVHGRAGAILKDEIGESGALATEIADALARGLRELQLN